tara:strand:+ start:346 stop:933 length:588 start_codon:yes stop_codon:yes gene_type:complete
MISAAYGAVVLCVSLVVLFTGAWFFERRESKQAERMHRASMEAVRERYNAHVSELRAKYQEQIEQSESYRDAYLKAVRNQESVEKVVLAEMSAANQELIRANETLTRVRVERDGLKLRLASLSSDFADLKTRSGKATADINGLYQKISSQLANGYGDISVIELVKWAKGLRSGNGQWVTSEIKRAARKAELDARV